MSEWPYVVVDVFTERAFAGNPLAVITDARGLSTGSMQKIAAEFDFSETVFVLPPEDPANTARLRIFNRILEMPFAGHPNVGAGFVLGRMGDVFGRRAGDLLRFEELAGLVEVTPTHENDAVAGAAITAPEPLETGETLPADILAEALAIAPERILARHAPTIASVGLPFVLAETDAEGIEAASADPRRFAAARAALRTPLPADRFGVYLYHRRSASALEARMFSPLSGTDEDPATGSAAAALTAFLTRLDPSGPRAFAIEQGARIGRPSSIETRAEERGVTIAGRCAPVMRGTIEAH